MDGFDLFLKVLAIFIAGSFFLRLSGRKSISQMTSGEVVLTITLGTVLANPITSRSVEFTIYSVAFFTLFFIIAELLQIKFNFFEKLFTGKSVDVIKDGTLNINELGKLRLTVDQLEIRLRENGVSRIEDVKTATVEANGKLGYELKASARPITEKDLERVLEKHGLIKLGQQSQTSSSTIFDEVKNKNTEQRNQNEKLK
ncbi:DUF421 domain-containing protein [Haloplasma contractile]|uniref:Transmembrane protein YdfR n=1 Tax=Haloplasma contractile SSD-17B TaxID=1033810 RepID=U2E8G6_9MOLU|nr:YetF domain-containing protein [Haloplasma contractile]ERJ11186.1 transmembrane protein YdfR [Haloplasma contractile SSD-17B]